MDEDVLLPDAILERLSKFDPVIHDSLLLLAKYCYIEGQKAMLKESQDAFLKALGELGGRHPLQGH